MDFLVKLLLAALFALTSPAVGVLMLGVAPALGWLLIAAPLLVAAYFFATALA